MVENSSEWRSLDSEIPSFKLQEKISRGRFEKLSKNCQNFWSAKLLSSQVFVVSLYNKDRDWHFWSTRFDFWAKSWICRISTHFWKRVILTVLSFVAGRWKVFIFDPHIQEEQPSHFFFVKIYFTRSLGVNSCLRIILYLFHSVYRNVPISGAFSIYVAQVPCSENGPDEMTNMSWSLVLQLSSLLSEPRHGGNMLVS